MAQDPNQIADDDLLALRAKMYWAKRAKDVGSQTVKGLKRQVAPMAGQLAGGILGQAAATATGGLATPLIGVGMGLGNAGGEIINQAFDIGRDEPQPMDWEAVAQAYATPIIANQVIQGGRALWNLGPANGARALNAIAGDEALVKIGVYGDPKAVKDTARKFFSTASQTGGKINVPRTLTEIDHSIDLLSKGSEGLIKKHTPVLNRLRSLRDLILQSGKAMKPDDLQAELAGLDVDINTIKKSGGPGMAAYSAVRAKLADDLDDAADAAAKAFHSGKPLPFGGASAAALVQGRNAWKRGQLLEDMTDYIKDSIALNRGQGLDAQFNANRLVTKLSKDKFFRQVFSPEEQMDIVKTFGVLNKVAALQTPQGVNAGSMRFAKEAFSGLVAGGAAMNAAAHAGMNPLVSTGVGVGGVIAGASALPAIETAQNMAVASQLQTGRALMQALFFEGKGALTPVSAMILDAFVKNVKQQFGTEMTQ